jgi:sortase (surface protein transpeptidase)
MPADYVAEPGRRRHANGKHASRARLVRRPSAALTAVSGAIVLCGAMAGLAWAGHTARPATPLGRTHVALAPKGQWAAAPTARGRPVAHPTALDIPAIGVRTRLIRLGLTASGALQVPASAAVAGWYTGSPRPGAIGSAIIAGHIDSHGGPGVFFRLRELKPGNLIYVRRADGTLAVFRVTAVHTYAKIHLPTAEVYGPVPDSQLRLITCGGTFDSATGHYLSNVIVFAVLKTRPPASRQRDRDRAARARSGSLASRSAASPAARS